MIRVSADRAEIAISIEGERLNVCAEASCIVKALYESLGKVSLIDGEFFKMTTLAGLPFKVPGGETIDLTGMSIDEMEQAANELRERMKNE